jgi:hypothetical protein
MSYTNGLDDPSAHFQVATYNNNGSTITVTNDGNSDLQPDLIWNKQRTNGGYHGLWDSSRGTSKSLSSNVTVSEILSSGKGITAFNTDGFTGVEGSYAEFNQGSQTSVAWQWKANGGTTATNTDGSTDTTVQANTDAGFSIVTFTTDGGNETYGHGLGVKPDIVIVKSRSGAGNWLFTTDVFDGSVDYLVLNTDGYKSNLSYGAFTSSTFQYNDNNAITQVAYCFASKQGFSKYGTYIGNANTNGPFVYCGFKPAWVLIKANSNYKYWSVFDNKRNPFNGADKRLAPSLNNAEDTVSSIDFLSNGFKIRNSETTLNESGTTILYMAFAENPFTTSTGIPTTAR